MWTRSRPGRISPPPSVRRSGVATPFLPIGPRWLTAVDEEGRRRLDHPDDLVRLEIEAALRRDILVVPVLLQGAQMPKATDLPESLKPLARRNALEMRDARWRVDFDVLAGGLERIAAVPPARRDGGESATFWTSGPADIELPYLGLRAFDETDARFFFGRCKIGRSGGACGAGSAKAASSPFSGHPAAASPPS